VKRKRLVIWDTNLGLDAGQYTTNRVFRLVTIYKQVAIEAGRIFVLCLSKRGPIPSKILQLFDQVFVCESRTMQCVRNRHGGIEEAKLFARWLHSGMINDLRIILLMSRHSSKQSFG